MITAADARELVIKANLPDSAMEDIFAAIEKTAKRGYTSVRWTEYYGMHQEDFFDLLRSKLIPLGYEITVPYIAWNKL